MLKTKRLQLVIHSSMHGTTLTLNELDSVSVFQLAGKACDAPIPRGPINNPSTHGIPVSHIMRLIHE